MVYDDPESGFTWRPENYGRRFLGRLIMGEALARSVNNATIHLLKDVGIDYVMEFARRLGIEAPLERNLGLALGSNPVSLLELTRAYAVFPSGGREVKPRFIYRVRDREGEVLLEDLLLGELPIPAVAADAVEGEGSESGQDEIPLEDSPDDAGSREADPEALIHRNSFNVTAMSFTPEELAAEIQKHIPDFVIDYEVDPIRQAIADSWPRSMDDGAAREEWGWSPSYDMASMTEDMLSKLRSKLRQAG